MSSSPTRPQIAFFDFPDVFEDFYPHYGVTQQDFASRWSDTGNHAFVAALQRYVGDVIWYARLCMRRPGRALPAHASVTLGHQKSWFRWRHRAAAWGAFLYLFCSIKRKPSSENDW